MKYRKKIEQSFETFGGFIFVNRIKVIAFVLLITIALGFEIKNIKFDTSTDGFLHEDDKLRIAYDAFRDEFGRDEKLLIAIKSDNIFSVEFFKKLKQLHDELEDNVPYNNGVNSLITARNTIGTEDALLIKDLFEQMPQNKQDIQNKQQLINSNPLLQNIFINDKKNITTLIIDTQTYTSIGQDTKQEEVDEDEFEDDIGEKNTNEKRAYLSNSENTQMVQKTKEIIAKYESPDFKMYLAGSAPITHELKSAMQSDMKLFIRLLLVMVIIFLAILFKRLSAVILPIITVALSLISTIAIMAIFNAPITIITQILPSFLLAVTIGASVHLLSVFYKEFDLTKDKKEALVYAMGHSGLAIVLTSLTTAAGLWAFSFSTLDPVANLGIFASVGVLIGLVFTLVLLPAFLSLLNIKPKDIAIKDEKAVENIMDKILIKTAYIATTHYKAVIIISSILAVVLISLVSQLRFSHNAIKWIDEKEPIRISLDVIEKAFDGSTPLEIIIDTKTENGLYEPEVLKQIDSFTKALHNMEDTPYKIGKVLSIVDILKESNKALNANDSKFYTIPDDRKTIAQELFLFENSNSDDLGKFTNTNFSKARITIMLPSIDAIEYVDLLAKINVLAKQTFSTDSDTSFTGIASLMSRIMTNAIYGSALSYSIALVLIAIMMIFLVGNIKIGLISMIPNVSPILAMTGVMVAFDMPLDMFTMLIGAIAIGLAVDDTVHFMYNFRKYEEKYDDIYLATKHTLLTTGRAMLVTTIVLTSGFLVFIASSVSALSNFGILISIAVTVALLADFLLMPAILKVIIKNKKDIV